MSLLVSGSRLPVGSSASSTSGRLTNARAMATRCCSPPDSSAGSRLALPDSPTISSTSGTTRLITSRALADDLERERDVLEDRLLLQQPEVLEHAADDLPQARDVAAGQLVDVELRHPDVTGRTVCPRRAAAA